MSDVMEMDKDAPRGIKRTADEAGLPPEAPRRIKACFLSLKQPLDEAVVNKIAAGEIIVGPVNALKEMLENSVDAGSTSIEILVRDGGLKLLSITDNGHGIERDDMPILCQRFTTSKLKEFDDLLSIGTYGFRGEALASISHIAHVRVTTKTADSSCAWQAHYADGILVPAKPGQSPDPKPCAGRQGTQITVEDLFYSIPHRRKAFRSPSEEHAKILDMVTRYAIHREGISFSVKKHGESGAGFTVPASATTIDRIRLAHGPSLAKELIRFETRDSRWGFKAMGYASNANHSVKRTTILLFINHRAVESSAVKRAVEQTYQLFLPKGGHPFVYLSLEIDPGRVDVNVHPTKREVHFLNEEEIIELVCTDVRGHLAQVDTSRAFKTQTLLPGVTPMTPQSRWADLADSPSADASGLSKPSTSKKPYENNLVRTDSKLRKITSMLPPSLTTMSSMDENSSSNPVGMSYTTTDKEPVQIRLTSIKNLRTEVRDAMHETLTEVFASLTYVGLVDDHRRLAAMQSGVKLFLVDYGMASNEFFYQVGITEFGNFGELKLNPPPDLRDLLSIAAKLEIEMTPECKNMDQDTLVNKAHEQLLSRKSMLLEYFSITINDSGQLETIPLMLKGYVPCMAKLPTFLLRLGPFVDWTDEQECFRTFLTELASFYVPEKLPTRQGQGQDSREDEHVSQRRKEIEYVLEHVLFPAFRSRILATNGMLNGVIEVANLKGLYRVFERC